jgi:hypothetical protein
VAVAVNPWLAVTGGTAGPGYAARFAALEAAGEDLHGEARRVHALLGGPGAILDHPLDAVVAAGNLWPLLTPGTHAAVVAALAGLLRPGGLLVAGFGLDDAHVPFTLPDGMAFPGLDDYDAACAAAGLALVERTADWAGEEPYTGGGYAVSVHTTDAREEAP